MDRSHSHQQPAPTSTNTVRIYSPPHQERLRNHLSFARLGPFVWTVVVIVVSFVPFGSGSGTETSFNIVPLFDEVEPLRLARNLADFVSFLTSRFRPRLLLKLLEFTAPVSRIFSGSPIELMISASSGHRLWAWRGLFGFWHVFLVFYRESEQTPSKPAFGI